MSEAHRLLASRAPSTALLRRHSWPSCFHFPPQPEREREGEREPPDGTIRNSLGENDQPEFSISFNDVQGDVSPGDLHTHGDSLRISFSEGWSHVQRRYDSVTFRYSTLGLIVCGTPGTMCTHVTHVVPPRRRRASRPWFSNPGIRNNGL
jgi:hypothetical protein